MYFSYFNCSYKFARLNLLPVQIYFLKAPYIVNPIRTMSTANKELPKILKWSDNDGHFRRQVSSFRDFISSDSNSRFQPEKDRYHLYISFACPWAHRTEIVRRMKGLDSIISLSVVDYYMTENGWKFSTPEETPGAIPDNINNAKYLREIYFKAQPDYSGRFTVPVLWDKKLNTIVNNESSEIIRMFNSEFDELVPADKKGLTFYPENLRAEIDEVNTWVYDTINNGVYKAGFATTQEAYEINFHKLFESLNRVESILEKHKWLVGDTFTEADIRLFTTIIRFDPVYYGHFKCNLKSIRNDYPHIRAWMHRIYEIPEIKRTVNFDHIKKHYYMSHKNINPTGVVPLGPDPLI